VRVLYAVLAVAAGIVFGPLAAQGGGLGMGFLNVSAVMQPSAVLLLDVRSLAFSISAADIERGYIDVPADSFVRVSSGRVVPQVVLEFDPNEGPFRGLSLRSSPLAQRAAGGGTAGSREAQLRYRFLLADNAARTRPAIPLVLSISL
jgi:hypothetical protein